VRGLLITVGICAAGIAVYLFMGRSGEHSGTDARAVLDAYCVDCHNAAEFAGDVSFEGLAMDGLDRHADVWEKAVRKLSAGLMPPITEPRPPHDRLANLTTWLTTELDAASRANPNPGAPALHRMNRIEYENAIRDLLDLQIDTTTLLPTDDSRQGFDNIAEALSVSPAHMQAYVSAAAGISRLAVGDLNASPSLATYVVQRGLNQADHLDGMPFGTRGGLLVEHNFPLDAEYEITSRRAAAGFLRNSVGTDENMELLLDGERLDVQSGRGEPVRVSISAGPHTVGAAVIPRSRPLGVDDMYSTWAVSPGIQSVSVMGPYLPTGAGDTPSRRRIFVCEPAADATESQSRQCAERILMGLARRAFRLPVDALDQSLATLLEFYDGGWALGGFQLGIQHALARLLIDPQFLYRFEREPDEVASGANFRIDDHALATRLSFFLWSSIPDDALLDLADSGDLHLPVVLRSEVARMLGDPRATSLVTNFASQWLGLRELETINPVAAEFDANLRRSFTRETELLFQSVLQENRSVVDLLAADYTFVDERLARHYDIPNIRGSRFRRIDVTDDARRGLLGHGSILTTTSTATRTSPVIRGAWVLENLLGTAPPSPPPGVETNLDQPVAAGADSPTLRERLERHRADPACAACHSIMDPIGFALEPFDLTGQWRETDQGAAIDASGELWDGTLLDGPGSLREALTDKHELFVQALTERLLTYALGRPVEYYDMPVVRGIVADAALSNYTLAAIATGIVESVPFQMRRKEL
jgi:hypothetical protein